MDENENPTTETEETTVETSATGTDAETAESSEALGDAGKKALDSMKSKWHAERDQRRELERQLEELRATQSKPEGDDTPDLEEIKRQATREALATANARVLRSEIKAAAVGKLADPADALAFLDLDKFEVGEDGVDADEVADAIESLIQSKPHLAAAPAKRFQGTGDGGARKAAGPSQLTRDELSRMTPEQIVQAKQEGRMADLLKTRR